MECAIWERKLGYFGVIKNMGAQRWPKKILIAEENDTLVSSWLREIRPIMREVGITHTGQVQKEWNRITKRAVKEWELQNWEGEREKHVKLGSKMLCKFRINDVDSGEGDQTCGPCEVVTGDMRRHILAESRPIQGEGETALWEGTTKQPGDLNRVAKRGFERPQKLGQNKTVGNKMAWGQRGRGDIQMNV